MTVIPSEAYEVSLGNIPEWYTEGDVERTFARHCLPVPYKVVLRPGHVGKQYGFAYFALSSDVDFIVQQNGLVQSLIEWSDGNYALIRRAKAKASAKLLATPQPLVKHGVIRITRRLLPQSPSSHSASSSHSVLPQPPPPRPIMVVQPQAATLPSPPIRLPQPAGLPSVLGRYTQAVVHGFPPQPPPPPPPPPPVDKPPDPRVHPRFRSAP